MRLSELSIGRPVLASVMSLLIVVAGGLAFFALPVRELPDVDPTVVSVSTVYPGASPETVEASITEPLEQVLNGMEGIRSIDSRSAFGSSSIDIEFEAGRDLDVATTDVNNAVLRAVDRLPDEARRPEVRKSLANARPILWIDIHGDGYSPVDLADMADRIVRTPLQLVPGVAQALLSGGRYAMRVWLDPARMASRGVDALDVHRALRENNLQLPAGELEGRGRKFTVNADARLADPELFEQIVIREDGDTRVRIADVGQVELGAESYQIVSRQTARDVVGVGIVRQTRSNELEVVRAVRAELPAIRRAMPADVSVSVAVDFTVFVREAIREVSFTLAIAFGIVVLVNLLFLRSPTTTAITVAVLPVALVGTLAGLAVAGFSLNILTLLALVLSVGLLVDDSIVVQENIYRRQELGEPPLEAAQRGSREVGFPVIATTAAVVAVLIPLSFMTGNTGRLFREFALCMAMAVCLSTFVALSLVPMLCSRYLHIGHQLGGRLGDAFEQGVLRLREAYARALGLALAHRGWIALGLVGVAAAIALLFAALPQTFLPIEDRGRVFVLIRAPEGSTTAYTRQALLQVEQVLLDQPEVEGFFASIAMGIGAPASSSSSMVFSNLRHWDERERKQQEIVSALARPLFEIPTALAFPFSPASINLSNNDLEIVVKSSSASLDEFAELNRDLLGSLTSVPGLVNVQSDLRLENPQLEILFDRERAADLGVPVSAISESLRLLTSESPVGDFILRNKRYDVVTALASPFRNMPDDLGAVHVRARNGSMVPLSGLISAVPRAAPTSLSHYDLQRSVTLTGNLAQGAALGDVLQRSRRAVAALLPPGFSTNLSGTSREFVESGRQVYLTFAVALLIIYLVLAAQFESFFDPLTVMVSVPLATLGALGALWGCREVPRLLTGTPADITLNLYSQIGIILLVGLVTKNAILLVDFANQERARGAGLDAALIAAGRTRFRPILMTSLTSVLGAMPLALASSAGAESRRSIGIAVVGGLAFSTVFTLLVIPVVHGWVIQVAQRFGFGAPPPLVDVEAEPAPGG